MTDAALRQAAKKFREYWIPAPGRETGEDQKFWNSLIDEVLGMDDVKSRISYQLPVPIPGTLPPPLPTPESSPASSNSTRKPPQTAASVLCG